jgi:hypothetical protein
MTILAAPALPLHSAGKYVAGAYVVFLTLVLVYVAIMAVRLTRTERELVELNRTLAARENAGENAGGDAGADAGTGAGGDAGRGAGVDAGDPGAPADDAGERHPEPVG